MNDRESNIKTVLFLVIGILLLLSLVVCIFIVGQESEYVQTEAYVAEITKDAGGSGKNSVILNYDVGGTTYGYTYETKEDLNTNQKVTIFYDKKTPKYATVEKTSKIIFLFPVAGLQISTCSRYFLVVFPVLSKSSPSLWISHSFFGFYFFSGWYKKINE